MTGWAETTLGEVYDVRDGTHDSPKYQAEGFPLITSKNLKSGGLNFEKVNNISQSDYDAINKRSAVHRGDVLFAMIGTIGNPIVVEDDPNFAIKNVALFKVPDSQDSYFLKYYLESNFVKDKMSSEAKGTTQKFVGLGYLRKFPIKLPPLPEQKRIIAILDEAFAGIDASVANAEKNLANARELFESYLNTVFTQKGDGWVEKTINDIADVKGGKRVPKGYKLQSEPTKHPYITVANFNDEGSVDFDALKYVSDEVHAEIRRYTISPKDLYISIAGTIGKTGIIPKKLDGANLTENACKLVFNEGVLNKFVYFFTRTASFADQALLNTRVAAQPKLALSRLSSIKLRVPSIKVQQKVISDCEALWSESQRLESIYQQKIEALAELKQSILQKAFAGELTALPEKEIEGAMA